MTYWNPVLQYGVDRYADDLLAAGGAGLITPDITPDAARGVDRGERAHGPRPRLPRGAHLDRRTARPHRARVDGLRVHGLDDGHHGRAGAAGCRRPHARRPAPRRTASSTRASASASPTPSRSPGVLEYADGAIVGTALVRALREGGVERPPRGGAGVGRGHSHCRLLRSARPPASPSARTRSPMINAAASVVASIPSPSISYFDIGPLRIHFYALCIIAGIIVATLITNRRLTKRGAEPLGRHRHRPHRGAARDHHRSDLPRRSPTGTSTSARGTNPLSRPCSSGRAASRSTAPSSAAPIGAWLGCKWTGIRFWTFADALAPGLLLAQAIGRFGNWFNQELFGLPTDLPWGLEIDSDNPAFPAGLAPGTLFHPTFLYEVIWNSARRALPAVGRPSLPPAVGPRVRPLPGLVQRRSHRVGVDPDRPERRLPRACARTSGPRSSA